MNVPFENVLLTGGAGFIGSHVCEALLAEGCKVTVLDDFNDFYDPAIKEGHIAGFRDRISLERGDLRERKFVSEVFEKGGFDAVVHLAARAGVRPSLLDPRLYVSTNVDGTLNLLEGCRENGIGHFIFASSSSVYGVNKKVPFAEEDPIQRTISPYAATKLMGEQLCSNYSNLYGIRCVCLRFFTVYGPRQRPDLAIAKFTRKILAGEAIEQYGDGSTARDYTFIDDIVTAAYKETVLAGMSELIIAYQDDVIFTIVSEDRSRYPNGNEALDGALLYRSRLSTPLDSLELIFSITRLPPGPGAGVLGWVTLVLALIFTGGFVTLYRLGVSQINLAQQQQDFVSSVSHELKTPLTSIRMYGEMLKEGWADEDKKQGYYEFIHDESERLTRLISNVLHLARITRNEPQFDLQPTTVGELMSQVESKISNQVERAGFELAFNRDEQTDNAKVNIDSDCFAQIVINIVDNAIKFSKGAEQKRIEITGKLNTDKEISFAIRDFGPGIPKDQMKKIFTLFYRTESELTRETVGTGIGLAIVHQLAIAMKGKVDVVNKDPGAEFRLMFHKA